VSKRDLQLVDKTGAVNGTLWGEEAEVFAAEGNPVIAVKGARVSDFGGMEWNFPQYVKILILVMLTKGCVRLVWFGNQHNCKTHSASRKQYMPA
jgi:replication factor A1